MNAQKLLEKPISEWQKVLESPGIDLQSVESELSSMIQRATLLEAYISHRFNTGCGDQGHKDSSKHAEKTVQKVRKALGYSYPNNSIYRLP